MVETINHNGRFRLRAVVITDPSLRLLLNTRCGRNHKPNVLCGVVNKETQPTVPFLVVFPYPSALNLPFRVHVCLPLFGCLQSFCVWSYAPPKTTILTPIVTQPRCRTVGNTYTLITHQTLFTLDSYYHPNPSR